MTRVDIGEALLEIEDQGGEGPPVMLTHGRHTDPDQYRALIAELSDVYRTIEWGPADHGSPDGDVEFTAVSRRLFGLLDALGIERATLVGAADAATACVAAALVQPDRVRAIALLHPQGIAASPRDAGGDAEEEVTDRLDELAMPVLVVHGTGDPDHPVEIAHAITAAVSDPRGVVEVPDGDRTLSRNHAEVVAGALREFLEGLPA